ncbi:hypothetical protein [Marinitenerispora sediminis]|uniref:Uncharacterized protein n=1 Tax=Marinitenerispora sediminis TaxID=1931232 RepID=A0A368T9R1_9ACTN|nr:hypothetical protein [Marinitenerispora sediminis]RCV58132.1 hypothetical protein DEF28_00190 [Marinitenerispora sediminis]RCV58754.1 hypothetical protein DEF23_08345 [Marinitenerispora sediminis]RCV61405.1 hypothetical protein DEF24_04460 [Marinitenerispora sediminis]
MSTVLVITSVTPDAVGVMVDERRVTLDLDDAVEVRLIRGAGDHDRQLAWLQAVATAVSDARTALLAAEPAASLKRGGTP